MKKERDWGREHGRCREKRWRTEKKTEGGYWWANWGSKSIIEFPKITLRWKNWNSKHNFTFICSIFLPYTSDSIEKNKNGHSLHQQKLGKGVIYPVGYRVSPCFGSQLCLSLCVLLCVSLRSSLHFALT